MTNFKKLLSNQSLVKVLAEHRRWIESDGAKGQRAMLGDYDLSDAPLGAALLQDANLSGVRLCKASLHSADLRGAYMQDADLRGCNLVGADLRDANLYGVDITDAIIDGTVFDDHWAIVNGKFVHKADVPPASSSAKNAADYDFPFKFDVATRLVEILSNLSENDRRDVLTAVCNKFNIKIS